MSLQEPLVAREAFAKKSEASQIQHEDVPFTAYAGTAAGILGVLIILWGAMSGSPFVVLGIFFYAFYWVEVMCMSKCAQYLNNIMSENEFTQYVKQMQNADPNIRFSIQNYHMEWRTEQVAVRNQDGSTRMETRRTEVRVNTHYAEQNFPIQGSEDETMSPGQAVAMFHLMNHTGNVVAGSDIEGGQGCNFQLAGSAEKLLILTCHFPISFHPRDAQTAQNFPMYRRQFYQNNTRDKFQETNESHTVNGHKEHCIVVLTTGDADSKDVASWMNTSTYYLWSFAFLSVPYRTKLYNKTSKMTWDITKHFSSMPVTTGMPPPINSMQFSADPVLQQVHKMGKNVKIEQSGGGQSRREESGGGGGGGNNNNREESGGGAGGIVPHTHGRLSGPVSMPLEFPNYWHNQTGSFDTKEDVPDEVLKQFQLMLDSTFKAKATRDRKNPLPKRLVLQAAHRIEDSVMWNRYANKRQQMCANREKGFTNLAEMKGSGQAKTMTSISQFLRSRLNPALNETFLLHGTKPTGAMGIREDGFDLSRAGSNVGTMFGNGVYLAEASSKMDEYAQCDDSGMFPDMYACLFCRVSLGEIFRITESNIPAIDEAMASGEYDSVMGDREAVVKTYREFVVFDQAAIYPEYVLLFKREQ